MGERDSSGRSKRRAGRRSPAPTAKNKPTRVPKRGAKNPSAALKAQAKGANSVDDARPPGDSRGNNPAALPANFPIVGLGASAGGLEALEQFLKQVPPKSGMAFVVVQHLDPTHEGMLVELLQRATAMPVAQAQDRQRVEREHVYVIPPGKDLSLLHGALHLLPQTSPRGLNLPIDFFFRSLAEDQQERSIGVILSGMGSDGTLGLRAIKEKAGACFVQALASAKFDGMPRSAIDAGLADVVAPVEELPGKIISYRQHSRHIDHPDAFLEDKAQGALEKVLVLLRAHTGNDFSLYKQTTIYRRIERRMGLHRIDNIAQYVRFLRENPRELELLFKELLIGVTSFFRDPAAWDPLKKEIMPALLARRAPGSALRAWVPACSTGEEAYSLAMIFKESVEPLRSTKSLSLQIFATDLDKDAIERARSAVYPESIAADVSPDRLRRFFVPEESGFRVGKEIREMVVFATQNIVMDPPFTKLDILSCRNLLIYFSSELQKKLIPLFHYSLNPGGVLFLGSAETTGAVSGLFSPLDGKARLYRRLEQSMASLPREFPASVRTASPQAAGEPQQESSFPKSSNLETLADRVLVQRFSPLGVLCTDKGDILYISGRAGRYLEPAVGKANLNVFAMARDGLRHELSRAFSAAVRQGKRVKVAGLRVGSDGGTKAVDLTVERLAEPQELAGTVMIVIADAPLALAAPKGRPRRAASEPHRVVELEHELERARGELKSTHEEMQSTNEELKSSNEEMQSTNEELQSSNEELMTSKEEMQSLNEELQTVNHELQEKVDELSRSSNDMKNLLNSTEIATLFLDADLAVRRFTAHTTKIIKLIPGDTGRPITDLTSDLDYPALADDAREVLRTLVFKETEVAARDGRWYVVRIMPYRTLENSIDGLVITFNDASTSKALEKALRDQASHLQQMADALPNLVWGSGNDGGCDYLSRQWLEYTGVPLKDQLGDGWLEQIHPDDRERVRVGWRAAIKTSADFDTDLRLRRADGVYRWFKARSIPIRGPHGQILKWFGTSTDVEERKREDGVGRPAAVQGGAP